MDSRFKGITKVVLGYKYMLLVILLTGILGLFNFVASSDVSASKPVANNQTTTLAQAGDNTTQPVTDNTTITPTVTTGLTPPQQNMIALTGNMVMSVGTLIGASPISTTQVVSSNGQRFNVPVYGNNALNQVLSITGSLYREPAASVDVWASDLKNRINPSVEASGDSGTYFPGQGYNLLSPVQKLWNASANTVYIFYIVIMIGIAFLIVFRNKLSGDQAVSLFNALPSIIISLILVYFSYPLSALFIDVITVGSGTVYGVLIGDKSAETGGTAPGAFLLDKSYQFIYSPDLTQALSGNDSKILKPQTDLQIDDKYVSVWHIFLTSGVNPTTEGARALVPKEVPLSNIISNIINAITQNGGIAGTLLGLVFGFSAFTASLKLFFKLLQEYAILMLYPLAAPFLFLSAAIPGRTGSVVSSYFRRLLSASMSFILVYTLFLLIIIIARSGAGLAEANWIPPLLGYTGTTNFDGSQLSSIARPLIAYALFIGTPPLLEQVQGLIAPPSDSGIGPTMIKSVKEGATGVLNTGKSLFNLGQQAVLG